jgi:hypothetical protein
MTRSIAGFIIIMSVVGAARASAQERSPGPGKLEITAIPAGAVYFTENTTRSLPSFGNYGLGGSLTYNFNRFVGVEGEGGAEIAVRDLQFGGLSSSMKAPNMLGYNGNLVVSASGHSLAPYATGGIGGLTMLKRAEVGLNSTETFLTSNVGGGVKWYASGGRWGLRGDYRFVAVQSKDTAPAFFGQQARYGNRVYGGVIINAVK